MKEKKCIHKWKYMGFYNSGYYNEKVCIYCEKMELEKISKIMEPKEKAMELVNKFWHVEPLESQDGMEIQMAIECALIVVDEILDLNLGLSNCDENNWDIDKFYLEVKQEIEKL